MGYDCTLHLVDERAIREEFVPYLLGLSSAPTALDRVMKNADELWTQVRDAMAGDDPESAAAVLCQLAVTFSACSLPHQYERGLALCLWQDQADDIAVEYPEKYAFSPEPLFAAIVEKYPALGGQFPTWFSGNYSTGVFIPSQYVPEVLAWAQAKINQFEKGDQRQFKGLLGILRAAAEKHLAYWEATDLAIPMTDTFPGDPGLMLAKFLGNEAASPAARVQEAPLTAAVSNIGNGIIGNWLVSGGYDPFQTSFWDLSIWPPRLTQTLSEFAIDWDRSRDGRWLLFSETDPNARPRIFRPRLFLDVAKPPEDPGRVMVDEKEQTARSGGFFGDRVVAFRDPPSNAKAGDQLPPPLWRDGSKYKPVPGLPPAPARPSALAGSIEKPVVGIVHLADGADLLVWDGDGYERRGDVFQKAFAMDARVPEMQWTCANAGPDGFFYLSSRRLFEVHRGKPPISHAPKLTNIMHVRPGPPGSVILQEGKNKDGDVAKLYFPADATFIHIAPDLFDDREYQFCAWSPSDRFVVLADKFLAVPTSVILALPRYSAVTGRQIKK